MAQNDKAPAAKPPINEEVMNWYRPGDPNRMHYYDRPGGGWRLAGTLARTINEADVHWTEESTPPDKPPGFYIQRLAQIAKFHAYDRDWDLGVPGIQGGNGIMYHYAIDPNGGIYQTSPETLITWHAREANPTSLAVVVMAGPGDPLAPLAVAALRSMLEWMTGGRPDLPLLTPGPQTVTLLNPDGHTMDYATVGVLCHDETLIRHGHPPKGCPGPYAAIVKQWRALHTTPPTAG